MCHDLSRWNRLLNPCVFSAGRELTESDFCGNHKYRCALPKWNHDFKMLLESVMLLI